MCRNAVIVFIYRNISVRTNNVFFNQVSPFTKSTKLLFLLHIWYLRDWYGKLTNTCSGRMFCHWLFSNRYCLVFSSKMAFRCSQSLFQGKTRNKYGYTIYKYILRNVPQPRERLTQTCLRTLQQ